MGRPSIFLGTTLSLSKGRTGHHEGHEGHEVWLTDRAKNARVTKIVLRSL